MKSLLIVEDDRLLRERLVADVRSSSPGWTIHSADSLVGAADALRKRVPDAAFIDLGLPDGDGCDLIRRCRELNQACDILVITVFAEAERVIKSLEAGACGYLLKTDLPHFSGRLISTISEGGSPMSPAIARRLIELLRPAREPNPDGSTLEPLSSREAEILSLCARGLRYAEIATVLDLSFHTVNAHLKSVYSKLAVKSRSQAVFKARSIGLIDD